MKGKHFVQAWAVLALLVSLGIGVGGASSALDKLGTEAAAGTVFTYQGLLQDGSGPVSATCDLQFKLWDASAGGAQVGSMILLEDVLLVDGLFTARLDFGAEAFRGQARYLEVAPSCPVGSAFVPLPRQELTASPYALWALGAPWAGLEGVPADLLDGDQDTTYTPGAGLVLVGGQFSVNFAGTGSAGTVSRSDHNHDAAYVNEGQANSVSTGMVQNSTLLLEDLNQNGCSSGQVIKWNGSAWACAADATGGTSFWSLTGNAGTTPGTNYLGTSDGAALEIRVNGARALRLEPNATSPNLIGGYSANWLTAGVYGATIGGGGASLYPNRVTDLYGTVGGGLDNQAGDNAYMLDSAMYATVGGGLSNTASGQWATVGGGYNITAGGWYATVGGGEDNTADLDYATIGGGLSNTASGWASAVGGGGANDAIGYASTIGGGSGNTAGPGIYATVPGGAANTAAGSYSFAAGRRAQADHDGAFVWADSTDADFASSAADQFAVRAGGGVMMVVGSGAWRIQPDATSPNLIGGNSANTVGGGVYGATIGGGGSAGATCGVGEERHCWNLVNGSYGTIGGGESNEAGGYASTVGGGVENTATGAYATLGGGSTNSASGDTATVGGGWQNIVTASYATVGGGARNDAGGEYATAGGGAVNEASGSYATVGGGQSNTAGGGWDTVGGGNGNQASGGYAAIGGGRVNLASGYHAIVGGGESNEATGTRAAVGGGLDNVASGGYATVAGGSNNTAQGTYSFAAGNRAKANNQGCFVWGDSYAGDVTCSNDNRTIFRSSGGFYIYTNTGLSTGAYIAAGSNSWSGVSDRATKENFSPVDAQALLDMLAAMPIQEYNLKSQDPSIRHIGPVAQDFAAFGYGESDRAINMQDADGVALAAIQGLYAENQALEAENTALEDQLDNLEARLAALEAGQGAGGSTVRLPGGWLLLGGGVLAAGAVVGRRAWGGGR